MKKTRQVRPLPADQNCAGSPTDGDGNQDHQDTHAPKDAESHEYALFLPDRYSESDNYAPTKAADIERVYSSICRSWCLAQIRRASGSEPDSQFPLRKTICEMEFE